MREREREGRVTYIKFEIDSKRTTKEDKIEGKNKKNKQNELYKK